MKCWRVKPLGNISSEKWVQGEGLENGKWIELVSDSVKLLFLSDVELLKFWNHISGSCSELICPSM
jgi:hypothetical protein